VYGFRLAAILLLAILASISLHHTFPPPTKAEQIVYITKANPAGQKTTILLEDGSKVLLNAASTLNYPEHFSSAERRLQLQGEAFFEVAKDTHRPFTVVANGIATTALGTSFNIRAYEDEKTISIALATGKVQVDGGMLDRGNYELHPGESITYDKEEKNFKKEPFDPKEQLAWKEGIIYFHDASFQQIINKLAQWYGVNFTVENHPGPSWKYTGEFNNENLENVLLSISYAKKFDFEINNDTVKIVFH
jgi:ferric-dicitrate binding protein FerR (iron transport regulator)